MIREGLFPVARTAEIAEPADQNPHYLRSVTEVGERQEVVAHEDIYAANGMKLLAKGARIDRSKWEHLIEHKLKTPLELLLTAADAVDTAALANDIDKLLAEDASLARISTRSGDPHSLKFVLGQISLPQPISFRLTVMREDRSALYRHSLRVAIVAHYLGVQLQLADTQRESLLLAALLHDIGEMHTDPALLAPDRPIGADDWRFVHVHPITAYVVLQQMKAVPNEVMQAILQHHERLDGSGYPYGHTEKQIGLLARILAMAEMHEAVVQRLGEGRLNIILRLNSHRLDGSVVDALRGLVQIDSRPEEREPREADAAERISRFFGIFREWAAVETAIKGSAANAPLHFMIDRMATLRSVALQAGIDSMLLVALDLKNDDAGVLNELIETLDELDRMLGDLVIEIQRRTASTVECHPVATKITAVLALRAA